MRSRLILARLNTVRHALVLLHTSPNRDRDIGAVIGSLTDAVSQLAYVVEDLEQKTEAALAARPAAAH